MWGIPRKCFSKIGKTTFRYDILTGVQEGYTAETSTDPKGNATAKVFDKAGRLKEVRAGEETTVYEYYLNGNRKSVRYPNGALEEYTYYRDNLLDICHEKIYYYKIS